MKDTAFGDFVKEKRLARRLGLRELAERVGRSEDTVRAWEHGEGVPSQDEVYQGLAAALQVDEDELRAVAGKEPRRLPKPPPVPRPKRRRVPMYGDDPREMIVYWTRGLLTAVGLILLFAILVWAVGGLLEQLGGLFDQ